MIRLNLLVIRTKQAQKLVQFYELLGLSFTQHRHENGPLHYAAEQDNFVLEIYPLSKTQAIADNSTRLGFEIERLDKIIQQLQKEGIEIKKMPYQSPWGYRAVVQDWDGRKVELIEIEKPS